MEINQALQERYDDFHRRGRLRVLRNQPSPPALWAGRTDEMRTVAIAALTLKVAPPLYDWLNRLSTLPVYGEAALAGRDYPAHTTLMQGLPGQLFQYSQARVQEMFAAVLPTHVEFNRCVLDPGGTVLLTSSIQQDEFLLLRDRVKEALIASGVQPVPIEIVHCTAARFGALAVTSDVHQDRRNREDLVTFVEETDLRLQRCPLVLPVHRLYAADLHQLLE